MARLKYLKTTDSFKAVFSWHVLHLTALADTHDLRQVVLAWWYLGFMILLGSRFHHTSAAHQQYRGGHSSYIDPNNVCSGVGNNEL